MVQINAQARSKLNVLLAQDRPQAPEHWIQQLPRLLEPQGVASYVARTGREAIELAQQIEIHAALIELSDLNLSSLSSVSWTYTNNNPAGTWLMELFRRMRNRPPVVLIRGRYASTKQVDRLLQEALRMGVFSVLNAPVELEQILVVFRRLIDRQYSGIWPSRGDSNTNTLD